MPAHRRPTGQLPDIDRVTAVIREVAVTEIMPRFERLEAHEIAEKDTGGIVTAADFAAEERLEKGLAPLLAESRMIGEEAASEDASLFAAFEGQAPVWVIDPVDGTRNFAHGKRCFAVIIALCQGRRTVAGWIHDPLADVTAIAVVGAGAREVAGAGAWLSGRRLTLPKGAAITAMTGSLGNRRRDSLKKRAQAGAADFPAKVVRYGCVGHEYLELARGRLQFAEYGMLKPWDHAAGILIHAEAGGFSAMAEDGAPYIPGPPDRGRLLIAPDRQSWQRLKDNFAN